MDKMPLKKRKIQLDDDEDDFAKPTTENIGRKKCAKIDDGLAIKYNKLVYNFDKILKFKHFRKYCVFFDIFSKRHFVAHNYSIDWLQILNRYNFAPYAYEECNCQRPNSTACLGFLIAFKSFFAERRKYIYHKDDKREHLKRLYEKHSLLSPDNNFYDNRINDCFLLRMKQFEQLLPVFSLKKKKLKTLHKNMYPSLPVITNCKNCKNMQAINCSTYRIIRISSHINMNKLCDYVLKLNDIFLIPNYMDNSTNISSTKMVVYKTSKSNFVFLYDDVFYVSTSQNVIIIFDVNNFRNVNFFCNFNFYFVKECKTYSNSDYITINN